MLSVLYIISELFVEREVYANSQQFIKKMSDSGAKIIWTNKKYVSLIGTPKPSGKSTTTKTSTEAPVTTTTSQVTTTPKGNTSPT